VNRPRLDGEAVFWCAVAWVASFLGLIFVLVLWRFFGGAPDGVGYVLVCGSWSALCVGVAVAALVLERPSRGLGAMVLAMYVVIVAVGLAIAATRVLAAPSGWQGYLSAAAYGLSFGLVDVESFRPLSVLPPKDWYLVGALLGYTVGRLAAGKRTAEPEPETSWWLSRVAKHR
jgi:hypothetical protein